VYVWPALSEVIVYVVCVCGTVKPRPFMLTEYEKLDLSVDGSQASVTLLALKLVTRRFVGVVGGVRSPRAAALSSRSSS
jgi:hypothetical protein